MSLQDINKYRNTLYALCSKAHARKYSHYKIV